MALSNTQLITQLYIGYYNRAPDPTGLQFWLNALNNGQPLATIANQFAQSSESTAIYPFLTLPGVVSSASFVDQVYRNVLNRAPDAEGRAFWISQLDTGKVKAGDFIRSIESSVNQQSGTPDAQTLAAKTAIAVDYVTKLAASNTPFSSASASAVLAPISVSSPPTTEQIAASQTLVNSTTGTGPVGTNLSLTAGTDTLTGTAGNDTFVAGDTVAGGAVSATLTAGDKLEGGAGNDSLVVTQAAAINGLPVGVTISNIENVSLTSGGAITFDTTGTGIAGVTSLTATNSGFDQTLTAAATANIASTHVGAGNVAINGGNNVTVNNTANVGATVNVGATTAAAGTVIVNQETAVAGTAGGVTVKGGKGVITVNETIKGLGVTANTTTQGAVSVTGDVNTTSVVVNQVKAQASTATTGAVVNGTVSVLDVNRADATKAGTITSVTLNNFGAATVNSGALNTLNLSGTGTSVDASTLGALTTATATATMGLNLSGLTLTGALQIDSDVKTLNIASTGTASSVAGTLTAAGATVINVSGDAKFSSTSAETLTAVTAINVTNTAGASFASAIGAGVTFTGGAGADSVVLSNGFTKAINMGAGNDTVTYNGAAGTGGSVNAGDGIDTIVMTAAQAALADDDAVFNSKFSGFEVLQLGASGANTINLAGINGVNSVVTAGATGALVLNGFSSGGTLTLTGSAAGGSYEANVTNAVFNAADTFNVAIKGSTAIAAGSVTLAGIETVNINVADANTTDTSAAVQHSLTLAATSATTINVAGNNGLDLTNTGNVAVTKFDASGVVANSTATVIDTAASLQVKFTSVNTTTDVTIIGGAGNDILSGATAGTKVNTITGGEGSDTYIGGAGNDIFNLAETTAAKDTVQLATYTANGVDTINGFQAGGLANTDVIKLVLADTTVTTATGNPAVFGNSTVTTLVNGNVAFATGQSSATNDVIEINATLSSFGNLSAAGVVDGTELLKGLSSVNVASSGITAATIGDKAYFVAYQGGDAFVYSAIETTGDTLFQASEIHLVAVAKGVAAGAFVAGDFIV